MKCLLHIFTLAIIFIANVLAEKNIYKKNFDSTGKAYYYTPDSNYKGSKIAVGQDCTKVVITIIKEDGTSVIPSENFKLSDASGCKYAAEMIRYPGGKCTLPESIKYNNNVISSSPEDLFNYYNGKTGPLQPYSFKTENKSESGGLFSNKWVLIGIGAGVLIIIVIIAVIIVVARKKHNNDYDYSKRLASSDEDMKKISEPYIGLNNNRSNSNFSIGQPFNTETSIPNPTNTYATNWSSPVQNSPKQVQSSPKGSTKNDFLSTPPEPKRINSITYEEQQNYSNIINKNINSPVPKSPTYNNKSSNNNNNSNIPEEYEKFKTFRVIRKFTPQRNDELVVENGHLVKMIKSFEDGWTLCYNINTRKEGYIPKNKLSSLDQPQMPQQALFHSDSKSSQASSAYSTKPLLHSSSGGSNYNNSYGRNRNNGQRPVNTRNNSGSSRSGSERMGRSGSRGQMSPGGSPNKYYRKPSTDNYGNGYQRNQNQRYDM